MDREKVDIIDMEEEHLDPVAEISRRCFSKIYLRLV